MKSLASSLAMACAVCAQTALAQTAPRPATGTVDVDLVRQEDIRASTERAKRRALEELRRIGGAAAFRIPELQILPPNQFLERLAVSPAVGLSAIAAPKAGAPVPTPSVNSSEDGGATTGHPGVALLLARNGGQNAFKTRCTGTLIRQNVS